MKDYRELNDIVVATNIVSGSKSWSDWIEGYTWARKLIVRVVASQPFDVVAQRRGVDGLSGQEFMVVSVGDVPEGGGMIETDYDFATGRSFRIAVCNGGESASDYRLSLVLLG